MQRGAASTSLTSTEQSCFFPEILPLPDATHVLGRNLLLEARAPGGSRGGPALENLPPALQP